LTGFAPLKEAQELCCVCLAMCLFHLFAAMAFFEVGLLHRRCVLALVSLSVNWAPDRSISVLRRLRCRPVYPVVVMTNVWTPSTGRIPCRGCGRKSQPFHSNTPEGQAVVRILQQSNTHLLVGPDGVGRWFLESFNIEATSASLPPLSPICATSMSRFVMRNRAVMFSSCLSMRFAPSAGLTKYI